MHSRQWRPPSWIQFWPWFPDRHCISDNSSIGSSWFQQFAPQQIAGFLHLSRHVTLHKKQVSRTAVRGRTCSKTEIRRDEEAQEIAEGVEAALRTRFKQKCMKSWIHTLYSAFKPKKAIVRKHQQNEWCQTGYIGRKCWEMKKEKKVLHIQQQNIMCWVGWRARRLVKKKLKQFDRDMYTLQNACSCVLLVRACDYKQAVV